VFEFQTAKFGAVQNLVLPIPRRDGYYPAILGIGYARDTIGQTALHLVRIFFGQLNDAGSFDTDAGKYILVEGDIRFFTVLSDGERSICPPFVGGGAAPYGLGITAADTGDMGQLRAYLRWMPRTNAYPGNVSP
jgi:hypothetical protein